MSNPNIAELIDPRLLEAAWHRYEAARELSRTARAFQCAKELHEKAGQVHTRAVTDYDNLERDIARGVRKPLVAGQGAQ